MTFNAKGDLVLGSPFRTPGKTENSDYIRKAEIVFGTVVQKSQLERTDTKMG